MFYIISLLLIAYCSSFNICGNNLFHSFGKKVFVTTTKLSNNIDTFSSNKHENSQIFIGNLPFTIDESSLTNYLKEKDSSEIVSVKIIKDKESGRSRGFGYVTYKTLSEAETAAAALSSLEIDGRLVKVEIAVAKPNDRTNSNPKFSQRNSNDKFSNENKLFIGNLDFNVQESDIASLCDEKLGPGVVQRIDLVFDKETRRVKGFGYLHFSSKEDTEKAFSTLKGSEILGRELRVDTAQSKTDKDKPFSASPPRQPRTTSSEYSLYIGNLSWDVDSKIIEDMISDMVGVGLCTNVRMAIDRETGRSRGFCHVDFKDAESMELAMSQLTGVELYSRTLKVDKAQSKRYEGGTGKRTFSRDRYSDSEQSGSFSSW